MEGDEASIDYPALLHEALVGVVRRVLTRTAEHGLPGDHQLYLTFGTGESGVELSAALRRQYPDEMTIVLQHQFWNLVVNGDRFAVTLRFSGKPERLVVPWSALRSFADPSANFGFRLQAAPEEPGPAEALSAVPTGSQEPAAAEPKAKPEATKVADIREFRRRPDGNVS